MDKRRLVQGPCAPGNFSPMHANLVFEKLRPRVQRTSIDMFVDKNDLHFDACYEHNGLHNTLGHACSSWAEIAVLKLTAAFV